MANMSSISKLHQQKPQIAELPQRAPVKLSNLNNSEPDLLALFQQSLTAPVRRRFGSPGRFARPAADVRYASGGGPQGRNSFGALAMRESVQQMRATLTRRYSQQARGAGASHPQHGPLAIQL